MAELEYRVLTPEDITACREDVTMLTQAILADNITQRYPEDLAEQYVSKMPGYIADGSACIVGALRDGELAGASLGHLVHWCEGLEYFIDEFFIVPDRQGQGLGTRFLSAIEEAVCEKGVHHLFLLTDRNTPACHFYRKAGMRVLETNVAFTKKLR